MKKERRDAYVEVLEVLNNMESKYVKKIPSKLIEFFERNASREYIFHLDSKVPFEEQVLKDTTLNILAMINYNYWCEDEEHKRYLLNKYNENEIKYQEMLIEKYSRDNLFKREDKVVSTVPQKYEEIKWYQKILEYFKQLFNR